MKAGEKVQRVQRLVRRCKGEKDAKAGKNVQRVRRVQSDAKFCVPSHPAFMPFATCLHVLHIRGGGDTKTILFLHNLHLRGGGDTLTLYPIMQRKKGARVGCNSWA